MEGIEGNLLIVSTSVAQAKDFQKNLTYVTVLSHHNR